MKMKKIIAPTMTLAMKKVKEELGSEAIIFQTRKVTDRRFFNLIKKEHIEILAALDPDGESTLNSSPQLSEKKSSGTNDPPAQAATKIPFTRVTGKVDRLFKGPEMIEQLRTRLVNGGILETHVDALLHFLIKKWYQYDERLDVPEMNRLLRSQLMMKIGASRFLRPSHAHSLMLIGPTGVGKTTTLAKMAGREVLESGKRVALITVDTYRMAAIDQLKKYAEILKVPMAVAYSSEELKRCLDQFADYDRVFIDTAGRNFLDQRYIQEIKTIASGDLSVETALVLSATSKFEDMDKIVHQFDDMTINHFIFSKMDETTTIGALINLLVAFPEPDILYITNGQDVPDDLQKPDLQQFIDQLLGDADDS
ncbi:MAG: flagellar biosynthesis regulator FlhF [Sporolactobacillus sp.]